MDNRKDKIKWIENHISSHTKKTLQIAVFFIPITGWILLFFIFYFFPYNTRDLLSAIVIQLAIFIIIYLAYLRTIHCFPSHVGYCKEGIYYVKGKDKGKSIIPWKDVITIRLLSLNEGGEYEVRFRDAIGRKRSFCVNSVLGHELKEYFRKVLKAREKDILEKVKK